MGRTLMTLNRRRFLINSSLATALSPLTSRVWADLRTGLKTPSKTAFNWHGR